MVGGLPEGFILDGGPSVGDLAARTALLTGKSLASGMGSVADFFTTLPYNAAVTAGKGIVNLAGAAMGIDPTLSPYSDSGQVTPIATTLQNLFDRSTAGTPYSTAPQNAVDRVLQTAGQFLASGGGFGGLAKAAPELANFAPQGVQGLLSYLGAGIGSGAAHEVAPNNPYVDLGLTALGAATPYAGNATVGGLRNLANVNPGKLQDFQNAGIRPTLADISDSGVVKSAQDALGEVPFAAGVIDRGKEATLSDARNILDDAGLSQAKSTAQAGQIVKEGLTDWLKTGKKEVSALYDTLDTHLPGNEIVNPAPLEQNLEAITQKASITPGLAKNFTSSDAGQVVKDIQQDIKAAVSNGIQGLPYNAIKQYRTLIGSKLQDFQFLKSSDEAALGKIYSGLTDTMKQAAKAKGPKALKAFNAANEANAAFMEKGQSLIQPLLKRNDVQELFNSVLTQQKIGAKSQAVMDSLANPQKLIVRGSLINQMGYNAAHDEFSPLQFATKYNKLEPEAQSALLSGLTPDQKNTFNKAIEVLQNVKQTAGKGNPSRTAYTGLMIGAVPAFIHSPITTTLGLVGARITARLMTNQRFINWLANAENGLEKNPNKYISLLSTIAAKETPAVADDIKKLQGDLNGANDNDNRMDGGSLPGGHGQGVVGGNAALPKGFTLDAPTQPQQPPQPGPINPDAIAPQAVIHAPEAPADNAVLSGIDNASKLTGVPSNLLHTIAAAESNLNPNAKNPNSSAKGLFQMTQGTWKQMVNKYGGQFGIGYKDINDPQANATMAAMLTQDNASRMQNKLGRTPTAGEIYLAHFMGVPGAVKLMAANPDAKAASLFPKAARDNRSVFFDGSKPKTTAEVYHEITGKVQDIVAPPAEAAAPKQTEIQRAAISAVPQQAQQALIANPDRAHEFDAMFGNGLAQLILQNK